MRNSRQSPRAKEQEAKLKAKAEIELRRRKAAYKVSPFKKWLVERFPDWTWDWLHLIVVLKALKKLRKKNTKKKLMILMPPRHGKSELVTVRWVAWNIERDPTLRAIIGAYNSSFASGFTRKIRNMLREQAPYVHISKDVHAAGEWETTEGGGAFATGVGTGVTGRGANIIVVDDPVKSREEANSEAFRRRVWNWWTNDLFTRQEPDCIIVVIMTQWHEDDLAGRILDGEDADEWEVVRLPAIAETREERNEYHRKIGIPKAKRDPIGRKPGAPLCPERYGLRFFATARKVLGRRYFSALFQQRPQPSEGNMFNRADFRIQQVLPIAIEAQFVRYWDKAGTKDAGKFTAGTLMMALRGLYYVVDVVRGQWKASKREQAIENTAMADRGMYGEGRVTIWQEQEPGSGGKESAEATVIRLAGFNVKSETVSGSKEIRAEPYSVQVEAGNVILIEAEWNTPYLDEMESFPDGKFNDQGDSSAGAFNKLAMTYVDTSGLTAELDDYDLGALNTNWG